MTTNNQLVIKTERDLATILNKDYKNQITNYFGDSERALRFMSSVRSAVQATPELLNCRADTVINSFMTMAQLGLMASNVSGEAYVLPYKGQAQFQLGYQGLVTLLYRAGAKKIVAEIIRKNDDFKLENGDIYHSPDIFSDRGEAIGAYVIVTLQTGGTISKAMTKDEIMAIGAKYSKSFKSEYSPWNPANDPELWMWKKTVLKQSAKLMPKNETLNRAMAEDNKETILADRLDKAKKESDQLKLGGKTHGEKETDEDQEQDITVIEPTESSETPEQQGK